MMMFIDMDARVLLEQYFDVAFAAPDGVKRSRELILSLAMQGKLVPQDSRDTPARELLKEIEAEKKRLVKEKKIKKSKPLPEITPEEIPYDLPESWEWIRLDDLTEKIGSGSTPRGGKNAYVDIGVPFFRSQNIWNDGLHIDDVAYIPKETHQKMAATTVRAKDILLNITGASLGRCAIVPDNFQEANVSQHVTIIRCIQPKIRYFLHLFFLSTYGQSMIWSRQVGMSREGLSKKVLEQFTIALPPLEEQHRIVEKIDRLMQQCDRLEKLREERDRKRLTIQTAASDRLLNAKGDREFGEAWDFIRDNFSDLYSVKENVSELRKAILQLAVMGKLVPQDPSDRPASELIKEIEAEKKKLIKKGQIKQQNERVETTGEKNNYQLPTGWEYIQFGEVGYIIGGGTPKKSNPEYWDGLIPWVSPKDMKVDYIFDSKNHVSELALSNSTIKLIPENSLIMVVRGMILAHSFPTAITRTVITINQDMKALIPYSLSIIRYLLLLTKGRKNHFLNLVERSTHGTCRLGTNNIFSTVLALPPLPEQHRIVAKVDRLMKLCDELEKASDRATEKQTNLLNAIAAKI